jgi:hypothetical protein
MYTIIEKLDKIEARLPSAKYRGKCEPTEDDPFYCSWDRFYAMSSLFASAVTVALVGTAINGVMTADEFRETAEEAYSNICLGKNAWNVDFIAFGWEGESTHDKVKAHTMVCNDLMRRKDDAMQLLISWLWFGIKSGTRLGVASLITSLNSGLSKIASILRKAHCKRVNYNDPRFCRNDMSVQSSCK